MQIGNLRSVGRKQQRTSPCAQGTSLSVSQETDVSERSPVGQGDNFGRASRIRVEMTDADSKHDNGIPKGWLYSNANEPI
jgi:hypothetical protein